MSNDPTLMMHGRDGELPRLLAEQQNTKQSKMNEEENFVFAVHYKPSAGHNEQVDCNNAVKNMNENSSNNWKEELSIPK